VFATRRVDHGRPDPDASARSDVPGAVGVATDVTLVVRGFVLVIDDEAAVEGGEIAAVQRVPEREAIVENATALAGQRDRGRPRLRAGGSR